MYTKKVFKIMSMFSHVCRSFLFDGLFGVCFLFFWVQIIIMEVPNE